MRTEYTVLLSSLPHRRPSVPGLDIGATVTGTRYGRRFRVVSTDEWVIGGDDEALMATGPYALLQALDDPACTVIWPADWYEFHGQQLQLLEVA